VPNSTKKTSNVTTYSKFKKQKTNIKNTSLNNYVMPTLLKQKAIVSNSKNLQYNNANLNQASNIYDIENAPVYPGCERKTTEKGKKNCLATKISNYLINNFNTSSFKNLNLNKGVNNIRVLFVIDKYGKSKAYKVIGDWDPKIKQEAYRVIRSLPKMKPGNSKGMDYPVKYSFRIPFITK
jgi:protein TonB